ncbi:MAG TPA: hypothetical protein VMY18_03835, partial [Acidobacteriota bacterium]|nr:hypothetical protein [Acidobacteriota bacterium]
MIEGLGSCGSSPGAWEETSRVGRPDPEGSATPPPRRTGRAGFPHPALPQTSPQAYTNSQRLNA